MDFSWRWFVLELLGRRMVHNSDGVKNSESGTWRQFAVWFLSGDKRPQSEPEDLSVLQEVWVWVWAWDLAKCCRHFQIFSPIQPVVWIAPEKTHESKGRHENNSWWWKWRLFNLNVNPSLFVKYSFYNRPQLQPQLRPASQWMEACLFNLGQSNSVLPFKVTNQKLRASSSVTSSCFHQFSTVSYLIKAKNNVWFVRTRRKAKEIKFPECKPRCLLLFRYMQPTRSKQKW